MSPCERWCVCICMHRCSHRAGSSLIIGSTQDTWRSGSKSGSYQVGSLEQVLQVRIFCGLSTRARNAFLEVFLSLRSPHKQKIRMYFVVSPKLFGVWDKSNQHGHFIFFILHCHIIQSMYMSCTFHSKVVEITANTQSLYFDTLILCICLHLKD